MNSTQFILTVIQTEMIYFRWEGGGRGGAVGACNLGVIVVQVCEPVFQNLPHSYTWPLKNRPIHILDHPKCRPIHILSL